MIDREKLKKQIRSLTTPAISTDDFIELAGISRATLYNFLYNKVPTREETCMRFVKAVEEAKDRKTTIEN